jgi:ABC-2 type transport system ATP-binding protein
MGLSINIESKKFDSIIFEDVNIELQIGHCYGLIGLNGSGKSTLLNIITKVDEQYDGEIIFFNSIDKNLLYIPSDFNIPLYLTGYEYIKFVCNIFSKNYDEVKVAAISSIFEMNKHLDVIIQNYSFGMKKKIQFIALLIIKPTYVILDELTSGLDIKSIILIEESLKIIKQTSTIIVSSHHIDFVKNICEEYMFIDNKTINKYHIKEMIKIYKLEEIEDEKRKLKNLL